MKGMSFFTNLKYILRFLVVIILAVIFINYFFIDVLNAYTSKLTTIASRDEISKDGLKVPTITLCFNPSFKRSIFVKNDSDLESITVKTHNRLWDIANESNKTLRQVYDEATFKLNTDVTFKWFLFKVS